VLAGLAGLAHAASMASPWDGQPKWWLELGALAVLAHGLNGARHWRHGALLGWSFATAWIAGTVWWLYISMHVYGGLASPLAAVAVLALAAALAAYYGIAGACYAAWKNRLPLLWQPMLFGAVWLLADLARARWFTGFPWGATGYAHADGPLAVLAPVAGAYGIGFVAAALACVLSMLGTAANVRSRTYWFGLTGLLALLTACNMTTSPPAFADRPALSVALLQGNIPQDQKFEGGTGIPLALDWYGRQLLGATAKLVVAPETALPLLPQQLPEGYFEALRARFEQGDQAALLGIPLGSFKEGYTNSVVGLRPGAAPYQFDKHHLVPFGEFIPPLFRWFTDLMNIPLGDFRRGPLPQANFDWHGERLAPNICYEDLFGEEIGAAFGNAADAPTVLVNVSNIGWFGNTVAIDQHLQISRMRSLEFRRPMIRATNTGATVIIDHLGRVTHSLPRHTRGVLLGEVRGREEITPYAWWISRFGLWPLWLGALAMAAFAALRRRGRTAP